VTRRTALDIAILRTVLYADVFDFALTRTELHHFLMSATPVERGVVERALSESVGLRGVLVMQGDYVVLHGREHLLGVRAERHRLTNALWPKAAAAGKLLARVPFVRMVALTGALAMHNPSHGRDDFDYFIVTAPGRVWLARLLIVGVVRVSRVWGWPICPNFVLSPDALAQRRQDVYIAHEIAQAVPLSDESGLYARFRAANPWTHAHLPNAHTAYERGGAHALGGLGRMVKRVLEGVLGGGLGDRLERWEQTRKGRRFAAEAAQRAASAAQIDATQVKGHFDDHGTGVIAQYHARLRAYGLSEDSAASAAD
jgi:hypothetical protein